MNINPPATYIRHEDVDHIYFIPSQAYADAVAHGGNHFLYNADFVFNRQGRLVKSRYGVLTTA